MDFEEIEKQYLRPPDNEPKKVSICMQCGEPIHIGDDYFDVNGFTYCTGCANYLYRQTAWC